MPRPVFVRVRDRRTKHEWDEPQKSALIRKGEVDIVKSDRFPPSTVRRPPKHFLGRKPTPGEPTPAGEGTTNTEKE